MFGRSRKARDEVAEAEVAETLGAAPPEPEGAAGPRDVADLDPDAVYVDLGSLLVQPVEGLELRLPVDEENRPLTVLLADDEGVIEMRAFSAARNADLWPQARADIAKDTVERGGSAVEQEGPFGTELLAEVPVTDPDGNEFVQPTRVIGWTGDRWFLRATIAGRPVSEPALAARFEEVLRTVAVRRGSEAMAPGEPLPLRLPPGVDPEPTTL